MLSFIKFLYEREGVITKRADVEDVLKDNNFRLIRTGGRHKIFGHPSGVTVAVPHSNTIHPNTARDIIKLARKISQTPP